MATQNPSPKVLIFRRTDKKVKKLGIRQLEAFTQSLRRKAKVKRPSLMEFILSGEYNKLPVTPSHIINTPYKRMAIEGTAAYEVPQDSLGRAGVASFTQAQSVRLWIPQNLGEITGLASDDYSVVFVDDSE